MSTWAEGVTGEDIRALQSYLEDRALLRGKAVKLSSGIGSSYYFNAKPVTFSAPALALTAKVMGAIVRNLGAQAVGGRAVGAIPLALAIADWSWREGEEIPAFFVRERKKEHGTEELVSGSYLFYEPMSDGRPRRNVVVVDDVVTSGRSVTEPIDALDEEGRTVTDIVALVTRPEYGGVSAMREKFKGRITGEFYSVFECDAEGNLTPLTPLTVASVHS